MKAFILCGGEGTRLRPYTYSTPKPMLPIGGKPILGYVIGNLKKAGIKDHTLTIGYLHEQIEEYVGDGSKLGVKIECAVETKRLNTAGSVLPHKDKVDSTFVVAMGDHITNIDMKDMIKQHKKSGAIATIALLKHKIPIQYGVAEVDKGAVTGFKEKPVIEQLYNVAIYVFEPEVFKYIKPKEDFAKDVFPRMLRQGEKINAYIFDDIWFDIGQKEDYDRLNQDAETSKLLKDLEA